MGDGVIIGREKELKTLEAALTSDTAEFIAVYGRRRVGKTYLIKQFFSHQNVIFFELTGVNDGKLKDQLKNFTEALSASVYDGAKMAVPSSWMEALRELTAAIEKIPKNKRIVLFFDELPWLASRKSGFLNALEHFWNTQWTYRDKLILVACGSAASWMLEKIVYAKGGLHNRITVQMPIQPLTLHEASLYLKYKKHHLNEQQVLQYYMILGGVPHYLSKVRKGFSVAQNIDMLCFEKNGFLLNEFEQLFRSLYDEPETYINIIRSIAQKPTGIGREELLQALENISLGGRLSEKLRNLEEAGFVSAFLPMGRTRKGVHYKIIDEYVLFYLTWIEPYREKTRIQSTSHYWALINRSHAWHAWAGYAFEAICLKHVDAIKKSLNIEHILSYCGEWRYLPKRGQEGAQIDLVFDREDGCVVLCEIKYTEKAYVMTKDYAKELERKRLIYQEQTKTEKQIFWCLIASHGVIRNAYFEGLIDYHVNISDLFQV